MKILLLINLLLLTACLPGRSPLHFDDSATQFSPQEPETTEVPDEVDFATLSNEILVPKCISCHKGFATEAKVLKHVKNNDPEASPLFEEVKTGRMPKKAAPLNSRELEIVRRYVEGVRIERLVTFDELKEKILVPKCIGCHKKINGEDTIMKWINQESLLQSKLLVATESGKMPKNEKPLSQKELNLIRNYLNNFKTP